LSLADRSPATPAAPNRALLALVAGALAVGCAPILVRLAEVGPFSAAFWRLSLALPVILILTAAASHGRPAGKRMPRTPGDYLAVAAPGLFLGAELSVWHLSLHMTSVANATLLVNMTPIFTALFSWAVLRRPVARAFGAGLALAVLGVVVLKSGPASPAAGSLAGDGVALLAAMIYAGYFLTLAQARRTYATSTIMVWSTLSGALLTLPLALLEPALAPATLAGWAALLGLAWVVQAGGQGLVTYAIAWLPPTFSSLTMLIQPLVAATLAWALLGEAMTAVQIAGGALVIAGIVVARRG
jgi:drug/metabolite transporter (DMT)-like permease